MRRMVLILLAGTCAVVAHLSNKENGRRLGILVFLLNKSSDSPSSPLRPKRPPKPKNVADWYPPKYVKAFDDLDVAVFDMKIFFTLDEANINFIALMYAIKVLSMHVAQKGWNVYEDSVLESLMDTAKGNPQKVIDTLNCYIDAAERKIERMRILMTNEYIAQVCNAKPAACDSEIYLVIKMSNDVDLTRKSDLLLLLGETSSKYMQYKDTIHRWAQRNDTQVNDLSSFLRPLVAAGSIVHKYIFQGEDRCYQ